MKSQKQKDSQFTKKKNFDYYWKDLRKKNFDSYLKDPVHKEINFSDEQWIAEFAFSMEMIRLQDIKQLGVSFKTFSSATHNRYMHCLGTFQVAQKFCKKLDKKISIEEKKIFLVAALLHDIGHGPFSHIFESVSNIHHEDITAQIILSDKLSIKKLLLKNKIDPQEVVDVYSGKSKYLWINKLISSNLDVDRIDYLLRDTYHIGTHYASIDIDYLIERCKKVGKNICFLKSSMNHIESFLLGRYYMHLDIYDNKYGYIYWWALKSVFARLKEIKELFEKNKEKIYYYDYYQWIVFDKNIEVEKFILLNDSNLTSFIESLKCLEDDILTSFAKNFILCTGEIIAINWTQEKYDAIKNKASSKKINSKYLYYVTEKNEKSIYTEGDKNIINIYDSYKKEVFDFPAEKLIQFNKSHKNRNNKIILVNKYLIN